MIQIQEALKLGFSNWSYAIRAFLWAIMIVGIIIKHDVKHDIKHFIIKHDDLKNKR